MIEIFVRTLPFFAIIGLGFWAGRSGFFTEAATGFLTKFVFFFPLSAMIFRFAANLSVNEILDVHLMLGYLAGSMCVYVLATGVAMLRRQDVSTAAVEAQCAVIGNVGFLGIPMMVLLFGEAAIIPMMIVLTVDLVVFSSLMVILLSAHHSTGLGLLTLRKAAMGLLRNPMILSIVAGLAWSAAQLPIPAPLNDFLAILGGAATPGALFAIGASLASKSAERVEVAVWLSACKLILHPLFVAFGVLWLLPVDPFFAAVAIASAALPVAGNVYMLAQHYGIAPQRVSAAILISTTSSILSLPMVIAWVSAFL